MGGREAPHFAERAWGQAHEGRQSVRRGGPKRPAPTTQRKMWPPTFFLVKAWPLGNAFQVAPWKEGIVPMLGGVVVARCSGVGVWTGSGTSTASRMRTESPRTRRPPTLGQRRRQRKAPGPQTAQPRTVARPAHVVGVGTAPVRQDDGRTDLVGDPAGGFVMRDKLRAGGIIWVVLPGLPPIGDTP